MTPNMENLRIDMSNENDLKNFFINYNNIYKKNLIKNENNGSKSIVKKIQNFCNNKNELSTTVRNLFNLAVVTILDLRDTVFELKQKLARNETKVKNLEKQLEEALDKTSRNNVSTCSICLTRESEVAFVRCGHMCVCEECSNEIKLREDCGSDKCINCPICRTNGPTIKIWKC